jgi:hypothetical protein
MGTGKQNCKIVHFCFLLLIGTKLNIACFDSQCLQVWEERERKRKRERETERDNGERERELKKKEEREICKEAFEKVILNYCLLNFPP